MDENAETKLGILILLVVTTATFIGTIRIWTKILKIQQGVTTINQTISAIKDPNQMNIE